MHADDLMKHYQLRQKDVYQILRETSACRPRLFPGVNCNHDCEGSGRIRRTQTCTLC